MQEPSEDIIYHNNTQGTPKDSSEDDSAIPQPNHTRHVLPKLI